MLITNPTPITNKQLQLMAQRVKGKVKRIYLHWTGGNYGQVYDDYHINIDADGKVYATCELDKTLAHTLNRNSGSIGIALCCGAGAVCYHVRSPHGIDFGDQPPTHLQLEKLAQIIAILANVLELPITRTNVMTHAEVAALDGYAPGSGSDVRWDLWYLPWMPQYRNVLLGGVIIRERAEWYLENFYTPLQAA